MPLVYAISPQPRVLLERAALHAIHEDARFTRTTMRGVQAELEDLAGWLGLAAVEPSQNLPHNRNGQSVVSPMARRRPQAMLGRPGKEVIKVPAEMLTEHERTASQTTPATSLQDDELRKWARKHVERVHRLKRDAAVFLLGMVVLTAVWALVQWQDNGAFERFSGGDNPGDWEPWILYVALIWGFFLAADALKTYFDRPTTDAEIDRQIERLRSGA